MPVESNPLLPSFPTLLSPAKAKYDLTAHTEPGPPASCPLCLPGSQPALGPGCAGQPATHSGDLGTGRCWQRGGCPDASTPHGAPARTVRGGEGIFPPKKPLLFYFSFPLAAYNLTTTPVFDVFFYSSFKMKE